MPSKQNFLAPAIMEIPAAYGCIGALLQKIGLS